MEALAAGPAPAPRNQLTVASVLASVAMVMLTAGMLGIWAVKRTAVVDTGEAWIPSGVDVPEVPTNVILIAFPALCSFAQWAVWASKREDRANTVFAIAVSAFVALLIVNAQAFVWNQMGVAVADGGDDVDGDRERHVAVQRCGGRVRPNGLHTLDLDLLAVDFDAGLFLHCVGHLGRMDRTEELALGAGLRRDRDRLGNERARNGRGCLAGLVITCIA